MEVHHPIAVSEGGPHGMHIAESMLRIRREIVRAREGDLMDFGHASQEQQQQPSFKGSHFRPYLSRMITQPRGLFEAVVHAYGPTTATEFVGGAVEAAPGEDAHQSLHSGDVSDGGTCSSHEDGADGHSDERRDWVSGMLDGHNLDRLKDHSGQGGSKGRGKARTPRLSDEEWAKSILARSTGYGCTQRNQVVKYITQLEQSVEELKTKISTLSPQVGVLDQHRWILQGENDALKQRISDLSRYDMAQEEEITALQNELQLLRAQARQQTWRQDSGQAVATGERRSVTQGGDSSLALATHFSAMSMRDRVQRPLDDSAHSSKQLDNHGRSSSRRPSNLGISRDIHETRLPAEPSRELQLSSTHSASIPLNLPCSPRGATNPTLVKWPSTLYRSVSAIRQDLVEVAAQERVAKDRLLAATYSTN